MEGDAKGQVGGMEMPLKERERMAGESRAWKCHGCGGSSNEDILKEEGGDAAKGKQSEPVVPEELKFGFRDQMAKSEGNENAKQATDSAKAVASPASMATTPANAPPQISMPPPLPITPPPQPTRTVARGPSTRPLQAVPPAIQPVQSNGVPKWVDNAITGLVAALILMVFKKIVV